jgi:Domain of unknown function (DUF5047)
VIDVPAWVPAAMRTTHRARWTVTAHPVDGDPVNVPISAGSLTADATAYPRYRCDLSVAGLDLAPRRAADPLTTFGSTLTFRWTLTTPDGRTVTLAPVPPLLIDTVTTERGASVRLDVSASDASLAIDTDEFLTATTPPPDARTVTTAIAWLIRRTFPDAVIIDAVGSVRPLGNDYSVTGSPWAAIEALADTIGADVWVHPDGGFRVTRVPAVAANGVGLLATGDGGTIVNTRSTLIRGYSRVALVHRDAAGKPVIGLWADRSGGPMDVGGPYGRVTLREDRDRHASQSEADDAAARYARRAAGRVRDLTVEAVGMPWHEPGDTLAVQLPSGSDLLVLTAVRHDLTAAASEYTFRTDTLGPS